MKQEQETGHMQGAALLEAVIALAIVGVAATAIMSAVTHSARIVAQSETMMEATDIAARLIGQAQARPASTLPPTAQGTAGRFQWSRTVLPADGLSPTDPGEAAARLYDVNVRITWQQLGAQKSLTLNTLATDVPFNR